MSVARVVDLTDDNFDEQIQKLQGPVIVDFWAAWCAPCKMIAPALEEIAEELQGKATVAKVNIDDNGDIAHRFGIRSIPTLVVFNAGRIVERVVGAAPKDKIRQLLEKHMS